MANSLLTPTVIANELLMRFKNNLAFASACSHEYDDRFDKIGDTYNLRVPARFVANNGSDITSAIQDVTELSKPLQINQQKNVAFQFSSKDLTLTIDRFADRYLNSAAVSLANIFETDGLTLAYQKSTNFVGAPGTTPNTATVILQAGQKLDESACPVDGQRSLIINPAAQASMVDTLKGLFQNSSAISKQYSTGRMGTALGFDWMMSQNVRSLTVGTWGGTPVTAGASLEGDTTVAISGLGASGTISAGDKFTIAGVFAVNPVSGDVLPSLQTFTVLTAATASAGAVTVQVSPEIRAANLGRKTVSALPAGGATITRLTGTPGTAYAQNIAVHKEAFCYATVPLELPKSTHFGSRAIDKDTGLSIRIVSQYSILTDVFITRCDIAYGWAAKRPEWSTVITG
jgi:hypothetical protein